MRHCAGTSWRWRRVRCGGLAALLAAAWLVCGAEPIPFGKASADLTAREQPIAGFLQDLFGTVGVRVVVSPAVTGAVNGRFQGPVESTYRQLARAFNLVEHHDGAVLHVGLPQELQSRVLPCDAATASRVLRSVQELGLADGPNRVRSAADGTLVVSGLKRFVEQVEELARAPRPATATGRERPAADAVVRVFRLRYAWAQDMTMNIGGKPVALPGVASTLRSLMGSAGSLVPASAGRPSAAASPPSAGTVRQATPGEAPVRQPPVRAGVTAAARDAVLGLPGAQATLPSAPALLAAAGAASPPGVLVAPEPSPAEGSASEAPPARIEADGRLNAVIVRDTPDRMPQYESLIQALDTEPQAVDIEATLIDLNTDRLRQLGIQWRYTQGRTSLLFGKGDASDLVLTPATPVGEIVASGAGGFASAVLGNAGQFIARIQALEAQGAARVVSSPQVLTLANVEAVFDSSQTFYVRVAGRDQVDLFNVSAGTTLRVLPHVFQDGGQTRIKMRVAIEDGSLSARTVDTLPVVDRASISTQAMIHEGESLLVGGITRDSHAESETKVPLLGELPWVGALFRHREARAERLERLFLITPRLVATNRAAATPTAAPPQPALRVADARPDRTAYAAGEAYELEVQVPREGFLYCYLLDGNRRLVPFFPNPAWPSPAVTAGSRLRFPGAFGFRLRAPAGPGEERVGCVRSGKDLGTRPLAETPDWTDLAALQPHFERLAGEPVEAAAWTVRVP